ncbi:energy-coupling factor transporter transmembrane protein EcfT [Nocardioides sp. DS6]|uniref:Energy-coupling factor transporter transmembrane protein EcfT n=1 Tax=Nocardioides eburneus TaxID=3231482 RepID=A0ABV3SUD6_9ACTN
MTSAPTLASVRAGWSAARLPRDLHPVAWWIWGIGLAAYASSTINPWLLLGLIAVAGLVVAARRSDQPWAGAFRLYLAVGAVIVVIRVLFRVLLGGVPGHVLLDLPAVPLPGWVLGIRLLGPVTREALLAGLYDGLRLAAIIICLGAVNALANPKRLLRSVPPALYEVGTALVVAVTVLPQLADSVRRVRAAQALRAGDTRRVGRLRRFLVPVLEDALERSLALAAGMDTRGYGRSGTLSARARRTTSALMLVGLVGLAAGVYAVLDPTTPDWLAPVMVVGGLAAAVTGLALAGRRVGRTVYRPDPWRWPELTVVAAGVAAGAVGWWVGHHDVRVAFPDLSTSPTVSLLALVGVLVAAVPALAAPEPAVLEPDVGARDLLEEAA